MYCNCLVWDHQKPYWNLNELCLFLTLSITSASTKVKNPVNNLLQPEDFCFNVSENMSLLPSMIKKKILQTPEHSDFKYLVFRRLGCRHIHSWLINAFTSSSLQFDLQSFIDYIFSLFSSPSSFHFTFLIHILSNISPPSVATPVLKFLKVLCQHQRAHNTRCIWHAGKALHDEGDSYAVVYTCQLHPCQLYTVLHFIEISWVSLWCFSYQELLSI